MSETPAAIDDGATVRVKAPIIQGRVIETRYNKDTKALERLVEYPEGTQTHTRWFGDAQLEVVTNESA